MKLQHRLVCAAFAALLLVSCGNSSSRIAQTDASLHVDLSQAIEAGEFKQITSVMIARHGAVLYEAYFNGASPQTLHDTRSATKTLTALAVGAAMGHGNLHSADAAAFDFFTAEHPVRFASQAKSAITVRDLLTMSSSLDCNDNVWESPGNEEHMYPSRRWLYFVLDLPTKEDYQRDDNGFGPFSYCTAGSFLLGQIVQRATGQRVDRFIEAHIQQPLGITRIAWDRSRADEIQTGGGAEMTSRSLLKLGELIRNRGDHQGKDIIDPQWIDAMTTAHVQANPEQDYGYQMWRRDFGDGTSTFSGWYMSGNGGNKVVVFEGLDATVVITATLYGTPGMHEQTTRLVNEHALPIIQAARHDEPR